VLLGESVRVKSVDSAPAYKNYLQGASREKMEEHDILSLMDDAVPEKVTSVESILYLKMIRSTPSN
tara:strand:- start:492 stop:689 length:198 start_codon:yes stop_codon:yes gene_type:complete